MQILQADGWQTDRKTDTLLVAIGETPSRAFRFNALYWEEVLESRVWAFDWYECQSANAPQTHKIGDLKTPPLNYGQTEQMEQHFEVICVAKS